MAAKSGLATQQKNLSPELQAIVGSGPMTRPLVVKGIWDYIKANGLQDAEKKTMINPDEKLSKILGTEQIHMLKMAKLISPHLS